MEKILSFDLGTNSIGWAIREPYSNEQFKKSGVITFDTGVGSEKNIEFSYAARRTSKRSIRRLYQARKYKLWTTLELLWKNGYCPISLGSLKRWKEYNKEEALKGNGGREYPSQDLKFVNWIKLDFNGDGKPDYTSPYQLRLELITKKLDFTIAENKHKLGRALYHIAQHRGFKSSKKVKLDENQDSDAIEIGAERKKSQELDKKLLALGVNEYKTIGEAFARIEFNTKENTGVRIRANLHQHAHRKQLQEEVKLIFGYQNLDETGDFLKEINKAMFWQRPLRSQKGLIGKCTLEPTKYRCPASHPAFEEFRAWSVLNNIKYRIKNDENFKFQQLPLEYREEIYEEKFLGRLKKHFDFFEISTWLEKKKGHTNWILNYNPKTSVAASPVSAALGNIFGSDLKTLRIEHDAKESRTEKKTYYSIEDIWHVLFDKDDEDFIRDFASNQLGLDEKKTKSFVSLWSSMPIDYANLSLKAIKNINYFLRKGLIYTEATLLAKVPEVLGDELWQKNGDRIIGNVKQIIERNRFEKRLLSIANSLIAQNKALANGNKVAHKDYTYTLALSDKRDVLNACIDSFGDATWKDITIEEQKEIISRVEKEYQAFFADIKRSFISMPHLLKSMKDSLISDFDFLKCDEFDVIRGKNQNCNCSGCKKVERLYHPSEIDIYPPAKPNKDDGKLYLGSPKTGSFKNPMAMKALHQLRGITNYLIGNGDIDEGTRIVIEVARELNDSNKRWAYEKYQEKRRKENEEFAEAIKELLKDASPNVGKNANADNESDIDKFRLWYEMLDGADSEEGFLKERKFKVNERIIKTKTKRGRTEEEEFEVFEENKFENINKSLYFKLKSGADNTIEKYKLWKQQNCFCMYTGKMIKITDLFDENRIDFEHTLPLSKSLDNSLENKTVCFADYNRNVKKNKIPSQLPDADYYEILRRLERWEQKVKDIELHIEFWKGKSKRATLKNEKNDAIRQRHLWQFELVYWKGKVDRFKMKEIKSGFRNSQLVDTQIISKYASHYLRTVFNKVEVQKGSVTADFRKIFGIQETDTPKNRDKHSHHAKDAVVLALIPQSTIREQILSFWYEIIEINKLLMSTSNDERQKLIIEREGFQLKLNTLIHECNLPNVNAIIDKIDDQIITNNITKDQALTIAKRRIRSRGKVVPVKDENGNIVYQTNDDGSPKQRKHKDGSLVWKNDENGKDKLDENGNKIPVYFPKEKWASGDSIRGQLHLDTFYGKIKLVERDKRGFLLKEENGKWKYTTKNDGFAFVVRKEVNKELNIDKIVDYNLKSLFLKQLKGRTLERTIKEDGGIYMLNKKNERVHLVRHVRCFADDVTEPLAIKPQTEKSKKDYKRYYWAKNGENYAYVLYEGIINNKVERNFKLLNLFNASAIYRSEQEIIVENQIPYNKKGEVLNFSTILYVGKKVIFYKREMDELLEIEKELLQKRIYRIIKFEKDGRIVFGSHLDSRSDTKLKSLESIFGKSIYNGFSSIDFENPHPKLKLSLGKFNFAIEGKNFELKPDSEIVWKI